MNCMEINVNRPNYQVRFGNGAEKAKQQIMRQHIIDTVNESVREILSPKNLIKMEFNILGTKLAIGLGKFLGKCDRVLNKIPVIKNARDKKFAKLEESLMKRVQDGVMDADQAGMMLTKKRNKI